MTLFDRDPDVDALRTDRYLESLLAAADRHARNVPADTDIAQDIRDAASRLRRDLVRVHPSFRFEDRLAARLGEAAAAMRLAPAAGGETAVRSIPVVAPPVDNANRDDGFRPLLIGGALTSAALSIAGAAFVAWRRTRPAANDSPMVRAVRAAHGARPRTARTASAQGAPARHAPGDAARIG
jgi:hypothetical protein